MGIWLVTSHRALTPQVPGQGSMHLLRTQARSLGQSVFRTHSGRQETYGSPWYSGIHEHWPFRQRALAPQGDGLQGSSATGGATAMKGKIIEGGKVSQDL